MAGHFLHNADALCEPCVSMVQTKNNQYLMNMTVTSPRMSHKLHWQQE